MLCDEIKAAASLKFAGPLADQSYAEMMGSYGTAIARSQRFCLEGDVTAAIERVRWSKPSSIVGSLYFCRLPYPSTWIEWPDAARWPDQPQSSADGGRTDPFRVGALCVWQDKRLDSFSIEWLWNFKQIGGELYRAPMAARLGMVFSYDHESPILEREGLVRFSVAQYADSYRRVTGVSLRDSELGLFEQFVCRFRLMRPSAVQQFGVAMGEVEGDGRLLESAEGAAMRDLEGEMDFVISALIMLNTVNGTEVQVSALEGLNKRRRIAGKPELYSHRIVRLRSLKRSVIGAEREASGGQKRAHLCRGHFKVRKTGVYWWSPHVRGDVKRGMVTHEYRW